MIAGFGMLFSRSSAIECTSPAPAQPPVGLDARNILGDNVLRLMERVVGS